MKARAGAPESTLANSPATQRIDKWIWCARLVKTRTLASKLVAAGGVRLTRDGDTSRIDKASATVRIGDTLAFMIGERIRIVEINGFGVRRGPAAEARLLYTDHSPPPVPKAVRRSIDGERDKGAGRPTKKERRAVDRLKLAQKEE